MAARYGLPPDKAVRLEALLECLREDDPYWIDPPFAPRTVTLSFDLINFDLVCQLEHVEDLERLLSAHIIPRTSHRAHQTNAARIADFVALRYALDSSQTALIAPIEPRPKDKALWQHLVSLTAAESRGELQAAGKRIEAQASELLTQPLLQTNP
ncbi:MAG: hypothetical protein AAFQ05_05040 [Pseudomonadota bacterium]